MSAIQDRPVVLALHGFTLGGAMFEELESMVDADWVTPDLPGHGGRDATNTAWARAVDEVIEHAARALPDIVLGYSLGGRLALTAALARPELFPKIVLVSTSVGIADPDQRATREKTDWRMAADIDEGGLRRFLEMWHELPLTAVPDSKIDLAAIRSANTAEGMAAALRRLGQGRQPYLMDDLPELTSAITWVVGSKDAKYVAIAEAAFGAHPNSRLVVVSGASHNVVSGKPRAVADAIEGMLG